MSAAAALATGLAGVFFVGLLIGAGIERYARFRAGRRAAQCGRIVIGATAYLLTPAGHSEPWEGEP